VITNVEKYFFTVYYLNGCVFMDVCNVFVLIVLNICDASVRVILMSVSVYVIQEI